MEWKAEHQQIAAKHKICLCFQNNECIDYISCVYLCSSQPFSILLMHTAIFCLQQQTNAVIAALNPSYFLIKEIPLCTVLREPFFFFFFSTGKFTYMHMNSYVTSYTNAQLPLPQFGLLMTKTYLFSSPSRPSCISDDCCIPVSLKEVFLANMIVWKKACVFLASLEDKQKGHTYFWVLTLTYHRVLPLPLLNLWAFWNESYAGQSGSYFMISRYRKQCDFSMRKWWAKAFWAGNESKKHSRVCSLEQHPSV